MNKLVALAFILGLSGSAVQAMPLAPGHAPADLVIKVAGGCGSGFHRGPYGGCRPNGEAIVAGLHIIDPETGDYNLSSVRMLQGMADLVLIEWAKRRQGLVLAAGNPQRVRSLSDLREKRLRVACRQDGAGAEILFRYLLSRDGLRLDDLDLVDPPALTETDLAAAVLDGQADCGLAIEAVARRFRLDFVSLHQERFDLAMRRPDYFEPPIQALLAFGRTPAFLTCAQKFAGYDLSGFGRVIYNA